MLRLRTLLAGALLALVPVQSFAQDNVSLAVD
jgi:hypothetical protein